MNIQISASDILGAILLAGAFYIGYRAKKGDAKAQKAAGVILTIAFFVRKYFVFIIGALLLGGSWYYGEYM